MSGPEVSGLDFHNTNFKVQLPTIFLCAAPSDNSNDNSHKKERGGYGKTYILLCMVGVAAVFLLWKCAVHKRKSSKRGIGLSDSLPTNGYSYPQNSLDWDRGGSATRRKQVW